jgi:hypothetical protein
LADAVEPRQNGRNAVGSRMRRRRSRRRGIGRRRRNGGRIVGRTRVLYRVLLLIPRHCKRQRCGRCGNRMFVGTGGEHGHIAVLLDAHRKFGADQAEAFGAHVSAEQAQAGDADFRFWRARDHRAVRITHYNVAHSHGRAAICGALNLRPADFDALAAAEILLNRGDEPGAESIELNGSGGEPPP